MGDNVNVVSISDDQNQSVDYVSATQLNLGTHSRIKFDELSAHNLGSSWEDIMAGEVTNLFGVGVPGPHDEDSVNIGDGDGVETGVAADMPMMFSLGTFFDTDASTNIAAMREFDKGRVDDFNDCEGIAVINVSQRWVQSLFQIAHVHDTQTTPGEYDDTSGSLNGNMYKRDFLFRTNLGVLAELCDSSANCVNPSLAATSVDASDSTTAYYSAAGQWAKYWDEKAGAGGSPWVQIARDTDPYHYKVTVASDGSTYQRKDQNQWKSSRLNRTVGRAVIERWAYEATHSALGHAVIGNAFSMMNNLNQIGCTFGKQIPVGNDLSLNKYGACDGDGSTGDDLSFNPTIDNINNSLYISLLQISDGWGGRLNTAQGDANVVGSQFVTSHYKKWIGPVHELNGQDVNAAAAPGGEDECIMGTASDPSSNVVYIDISGILSQDSPHQPSSSHNIALSILHTNLDMSGQIADNGIAELDPHNAANTLGVRLQGENVPGNATQSLADDAACAERNICERLFMQMYGASPKRFDGYSDASHGLMTARWDGGKLDYDQQFNGLPFKHGDCLGLKMNYNPSEGWANTYNHGTDASGVNPKKYLILLQVCDTRPSTEGGYGNFGVSLSTGDKNASNITVSELDNHANSYGGNRNLDSESKWPKVQTLNEKAYNSYAGGGDGNAYLSVVNKNNNS